MRRKMDVKQERCEVKKNRRMNEWRNGGTRERGRGGLEEKKKS